MTTDFSKLQLQAPLLFLPSGGRVYIFTLKSGLCYMICFGRYNIRKYDTSRDLKKACTLVHTLLSAWTLWISPDKPAGWCRMEKVSRHLDHPSHPMRPQTREWIWPSSTNPAHSDMRNNKCYFLKSVHFRVVCYVE